MRTRAIKSKFLGGVLSALLASATLVTVQAAVVPDSAQAVEPATLCSTSAAAQNGITVKPSHGKAMYIDTGQGQNINAAYVGYSVTAASAKEDIWVQLSGFDQDEVVQLANPLDQNMQIGDLASSGTGMSYFLLSANKPSTSAQTHVVKVFSGPPTKPGSTAIYECTYSFTKVSETIKAAANKVLSISSTSASIVGGSLVVVHSGDTGTIGAGSAPDGNMIWVSPASNTSWPTRAYRLKNVSIQYFSNKNLTGSSYGMKNNELILSPATNSFGTNKTPKSYQATYTFEIIGRGSGAIAPVAQISSGTQIKHTDMSGFYSGGSATYLADATAVTVSANVSKTASSSVTTSGNAALLNYTVTVANTSSSPLKIDKILDVADENLTVQSAQVAGVNYSDYFADGAPSGGSQKWSFPGPFSIAANSSIALTYTASVSCTAGSKTYANYALAFIGDTSIAKSSSVYEQVTVSMTQASDGITCGVADVTTAETNVTIATEVTTGPASNLLTVSGSSSGTLSGTVDSNGVAGGVISCEYSTESDLSGSTSVAPSSPSDGLTTTSAEPVAISCSLTGLLPGTTYYYRVNAGPSSGQILSFTTPPNTLSAPIVTTTSVSNVETTSAVLNGAINPGMNATRAKFELAKATDLNCSGLNTNVVYSQIEYDLDTNTYADLVVAGGFDTSVSFAVSGLTNNQIYCYRILGDYIYDSSLSPTHSNTAQGQWVAFKASSLNPPTALTSGATSVSGTSATLNGSVSKGTNTATVTFCLSTTQPTNGLVDCTTEVSGTPGSVTSGTSTVSYAATGLSAGETYYFQTKATDSTDSNVVSRGLVESFVVPGPPVATTYAASQVLETTATISGQVSANGTPTDVYFCFSTSGTSTGGVFMDDCLAAGVFDPTDSDTKVPSVSSQLSASATASRQLGLTGLTASTPYFFQIIAKNTSGVLDAGEILSFTTSAAAEPPAAVTLDASSVGGDSAVVNGTLDPKGASTTGLFCYRETTSVAETPTDISAFCADSATTTIDIPGGGRTASGPVNVALANLEPNTEYVFVVKGSNSRGNAFGQVKHFSTQTPPVPVTSPASSVTRTSATISGTVNPKNKQASIKFCWGLAEDLTGCTKVNGATASGTGKNAVASSLALASLTPGETYYYRIIGNNGVGGYQAPSLAVSSQEADYSASMFSASSYSAPTFSTLAAEANDVDGEILSFTTLAALSATTTAASSITETTATLNGSVNPGDESTTVEFCYGTSDAALTTCIATPAATQSPLTGSTAQAVSVGITGLTASTTYYFRVSGTNTGQGTATGSILSFTTAAAAPTYTLAATTSAASSITSTSAILNGAVNPGNESTTVAFCYGTSSLLSSCQTVTAAQSPVSGTSSAAVSYGLTGLIPSTTYYFRVSGTNSGQGTATGSILNFTTSAATVAPSYSLTATSLPAGSVTSTSATLNGSVNPGNETASVAFCYSTSALLTNCQSVTPTQSPLSGVATLPVTAVLSGLTPETTYYFRVSGTSAGQGTVNGLIVSFTTLAEEVSPETGGGDVTLTLDLGPESNAPEIVVVVTPEGVKLPEPASIPEGYRFVGWDLSGNMYQPGDLVSIAQSLTAFAIWEKIESGDLGELADTGFGSIHWLSIAMLLLSLGALSMLYARKRD